MGSDENREDSSGLPRFDSNSNYFDAVKLHNFESKVINIKSVLKQGNPSQRLSTNLGDSKSTANTKQQNRPMPTYSKRFYRIRRRQRIFKVVMSVAFFANIMLWMLVFGFNFNFMLGNILALLITVINFCTLVVKIMIIDRAIKDEDKYIFIWWMCCLEVDFRRNKYPLAYKPKARKVSKFMSL